MATNEPMTDNLLDAINDLLHDGRGNIPDLWVSQLFDEACRARAREQALAAENEQKQAQIDAMRPVVEAVATSRSVFAELDVWVLLLENSTVSYLQELVTQARAFVAAHPTAAAGEAESAGGDDETTS